MIQSTRRPTHIEVSTPAPGDGEEISEQRAKQGSRGRHILIVLTVSISLVVIAFIASFVFNARPGIRDEGAAVVHDPATAPIAETFETPPPQPKIPQPERTAPAG